METVTSRIVAFKNEPVTKDRHLQLEQKAPVLSRGRRQVLDLIIISEVVARFLWEVDELWE
jgi:hypothetical protein